MRYALGALALTALNGALVLAQNCPSGYNRTIHWRECPTELEPSLECAILTVPLNHLDPSSSAIPVPLVRVPAKSKNPKGQQSIIYNPGGPGGSGISAFASGSGSDFQKTLGDQFNYISFDPRGVALSTIFEGGLDNYNCPTDDEFSPGPYRPDSTLGAAVSNFTVQGKECAAAPWGTDGQYVGTPANARDIVAIAQALAGEDGYVRYYGISYGTLLGSTLSAMFPDRLDRVILDGNINPTDYYYGDGSEAAADIDAALAHFFDECAGAPDLCALETKNQTGPQLLKTFKSLFDQAMQSAAKSGDYSSIYAFQNTIITNMFGPSKFISFAQALAPVFAAANTSTTALKRDELDFDPEEASVLSSAQEESGNNILSAVTCGDYLGPRVATVDSFRKLRDAYKNRSYYAGDSAGLLNIALTCAAWPIKSKEQLTAPLTNVKTRNPILFVNGIYDPVTPHISAQNSSAGFIGSGVLLHNGAGHGTPAEPIDTLLAAMGKYWVDGQIPAQRMYNKTKNSFLASAPTVQVDPGTNYTTGTGNKTIRHNFPHQGSDLSSATLKELYPRELLDMLKAHQNTVQRRATNSSSSVPAGCTPVAPGTYVGAAGRTAVATSAMIVAVVAALIL